MSKAKVDIKELEDLHKQTAKVLKFLLEQDEVNPKILDAAIKFLDNNNITANATDELPGTPVEKTIDGLKLLSAQFDKEDMEGNDIANVG